MRCARGETVGLVEYHDETLVLPTLETSKAAVLFVAIQIHHSQTDLQYAPHASLSIRLYCSSIYRVLS